MKEHIVMFCAGAYADKVITYVEKYFCIDAICDNNSALWGKLFHDKYSVMSPEKAAENYKDSLVLIAIDNKSSYDAIHTQLEEYGMKHKHVNYGLLDAAANNNESFYIDEHNLHVIDGINSTDRNIYVLGAPSHSNLGDQAQSYCIENLLKKAYPDSSIFLYDDQRVAKNYYELLFIIKQNIRENDLIFLHSGYRMTNLYMVSEYINETLGELFAERKITFLPQTVHYTDYTVEKRISEIINDNVTIMCRDALSYKNSLRLFPSSRTILYPDVVTSLIGRYRFEFSRKGILLVIRAAGDGESLFSDNDVDSLKKDLQKITDVSQKDTTIDAPWKEIAANKKYYIDREIEEYSKYKLIITNRYHGTIFSLAANTPVIVLPTKDHKITAGLKWFEDAGYDSIYFVEKLSNIFEIAQDVIDSNKPVDNPDYFYQKFYKDFDLEKL